MRNRRAEAGLRRDVRADGEIAKYKARVLLFDLETQPLLYPYSFIARDTRSST